MPELRKDPVIGRWVIIAPERGNRPTSFSTVPVPKEATLCPFCPGNESATPGEILAWRQPGSEPNKEGWRLRVTPNKYPVLRVEGELLPQPEGMYDRMNGIGAHEVFIETPRHGLDMADMSIDEVRDVFWAYRERISDLKKDLRLKYILIFKNHGEAAGASLEHSHSQLIATPVIPKRVLEELDGARQYYKFKERCVYCDIIRQEIATQTRLVSEFDSFIAYQPYASRFPFETCVIPKTHQSDYLEMSDDDFTGLAICMRDTLGRLKKALDNPPFNYILHISPTSDECRHYYHWHIEIIPKLTRVAGFEWGSGFYINPTAPEEAAEYLRKMNPGDSRKDDTKQLADEK